MSLRAYYSKIETVRQELGGQKNIEEKINDRRDDALDRGRAAEDREEKKNEENDAESLKFMPFMRLSLR